MGPGWAKKVEILDGSGVGKKISKNVGGEKKFFDGSGVGKKS